VTLPDLSGSGKRGNPCERMQAEYAVGLAEPEPLDEPEPLVPLVVSACATFGLDEPPQAAANRLSTVAAASASAIRAIRFLIRGRFLCWAGALTALTRRRESQAGGVDRLSQRP
jgi:hypothetical protein